MFLTKVTAAFLPFLFLSKNLLACPFNKSVDDKIPEDGVHRRLRGGLASLKYDKVSQKKLSSFFDEPRRQRSLQDTCVTTTVMSDLREDIRSLANAIVDDGIRGHFFGGIVRLAAHDFMDYDQNDSSEPGGSDGCIDFTAADNAGLPDLWCDDAEACPFKALYDTYYSGIMSKADFWVASATKVIEITSPEDNSLVIPFKWGRVDSDSCPSSTSRLPAATGCSDVEACFIDRMGLTWTDATALMGAHTLGRGSSEFSGHDGTWVQSDAESVIFDKQYYQEILNRAWRPNFADAGTDWIWGGNALTVMMLNTDICLYFDIPDGDDQNCCTNLEGNCRGIETQCASASTVRPEAVNAVDNFLIGNSSNNEVFFAAFSTAWVAATENGLSNLWEVKDDCSTTPTASPTLLPCEDVTSFQDRNGNERDCAWVLSRSRCGRFGEEYCPVSCSMCDTSS